MSLSKDEKERTLTIEKTLNAPVELVWNAWTKEDHIAKWWGPKGMEIDMVEYDFKVGGKWKYVMAMPDGKDFITQGEYAEIIEHMRIVTSADFKPMTEGVELVILFEGDRDKTKFTFHCIHPTVEYCEKQKEMGFYNGWGSTFERLEEYLDTM